MPKLRSTVYPFGYDKNAAQRRDQAFSTNFNRWSAEIREALLYTPGIAEARLEEAKQFIGL